MRRGICFSTLKIFFVVCTPLKAPVLRLCLTTNQFGFRLRHRIFGVGNYKQRGISTTRPKCPRCRPSKAICSAVVLNDKRHIITKDTNNSVAIYDVLKAQKVEEVGPVDFQEEIKKRFKMVHVPNWFNVDLKTGMLTIHLGQDEVDCFGAWVSARDADFKDSPEPDQKVNYGKLLLQALLEHWHGVDVDADNVYLRIPPHTPLILRVNDLIEDEIHEVVDLKFMGTCKTCGFPQVSGAPCCRPCVYGTARRTVGVRRWEGK